MSAKIWLIILLNVFIGHVVSTHYKEVPDDNEDIVETFKYKEEGMRSTQTKCSRRFTPGHCLGHKEPVWTYVPQIQNCTGRLGCILSRRTNRFPSFEACMSECRTMLDLYTYVLEMQDGRHTLNESRFLRGGAGALQAPKFVGIERREYKTQEPEESDTNEEGSRSYSPFIFEDQLNEHVDPERDSHGLVRDVGRKNGEKSAGQVDYDISKHGNYFDVDPNLEDVFNMMPGREIDIDRF